MDDLGGLMKNSLTNLGPNRKTTVRAGYTYFGQFVDHDITRDDTKLAEAGSVAPARTTNGTGPWLELNQLYGEGPESDMHGDLYEQDKMSFRLDGPLVNGEQFDVPLDGCKKPLLADDRSNGNLIIRQLHVMFLKLHNVAVREKACFEKARQKVRWQYQWLIRNDYLFKICSPEVYQDVIERGNRIIDWEKGGFSIPVEFSQAAFRFGHSMVRDTYKLNDRNPKVSLTQLFEEVRLQRNIPAELAIDWGHFMRSEPSMAIDTAIVPSLFSLMKQHFHHLLVAGAPPQPSELPIRTLRRGAATGLPTGEEVTCAFGREQLRSKYPGRGQVNPWAILDKAGLRGRTPLWYYILLEAELERNGTGLGYVGSRLVAETIENSLRADCDSFVNQNGPDWKPPKWKLNGGTMVEITRLRDIANVVGLSK